jgi:DNA-binding FrmR family transcriptional regulator
MDIKMAHHPSHSAQLPALNRAAGQIEAVRRMVADERYCIDILTQLRAARSALKSIELAVLETHMQFCLKRSASENETQQAAQIAEIMTLLKKYE